MAEQQQTATKYLLDELSEHERVEFEAHMFDCSICASQVRNDFTVKENLTEVVREEKAGQSERTRAWSGWLQPASLIPTFVAMALAILVCFQLARTPVYEAQIVPDSSLIVPTARGNSEAPKIERTKKVIWLSFRVDAAKADRFVCDFQNDSGAAVLSVTSPFAKSAAFLLNVPVPEKLFPPGRYRMLLHPVSAPTDSTSFPFAVEDDK